MPSVLRCARLLPLLVVLLWPASGLARTTPFLTESSVNFTQLLPPPPALDSAAQKQDIATLLELQKTRTSQEVALAQADGDRTVFRFADVLGPKFTAANAPQTAALFEEILETANRLVRPAKKYWHRPRPFVTDPAIHPVLFKPGSPSYPSAHATFGTLTAILLANMVPERRAELFARGALYAHNRELGGVHYPTDVEAGRLSGTVIAALLLQNPAFRQAFDKARDETRRVLGLGPYLDNQGSTSSAP